VPASLWPVMVAKVAAGLCQQGVDTFRFNWSSYDMDQPREKQWKSSMLIIDGVGLGLSSPCTANALAAAIEPEPHNISRQQTRCQTPYRVSAIFLRVLAVVGYQATGMSNRDVVSSFRQAEPPPGRAHSRSCDW